MQPASTILSFMLIRSQGVIMSKMRSFDRDNLLARFSNHYSEVVFLSVHRWSVLPDVIHCAVDSVEVKRLHLGWRKCN